MRALKKWFVAFFRFWHDFLIGETPELFVAALVIVGLALAFRHERAAGLAVLVALTPIALVGSIYRGRARRVEH